MRNLSFLALLITFTPVPALAALTLVIDTANEQFSWTGTGFSQPGLDIGGFNSDTVFLTTDPTVTSPNPGTPPEAVGSTANSLAVAPPPGLIDVGGNLGQLSITRPGDTRPTGLLSVFLKNYFNTGPATTITVDLSVVDPGPFAYPTGVPLTTAAKDYLKTLDGAPLSLNSQVGGGSIADVATISVIPEPATAVLFSVGLGLLYGRRRRAQF